MAKYNIGGYIFEDENKAKKAAKELKAVEYILGQIKEADEKGVLTVYKKLINQRYFSTEIGMGFLSQLRQNLEACGAYSDDEIPQIYSLDAEEPKVKETASEPVKAKDTKPEISPEKSKVKKEKSDKSKESKSEGDFAELKRLRFINKILLILCITLLLCVIGMFYVNSTINSPTILNYEEKLIDKYSSWEQELTEREAAVKEKELSQQ
jgi:hypothetical protein